MNTMQNYVGRDSHANTNQNSGQNTQEELPQVSVEGRNLERTTLLSLRKWAVDTLAYAEKGKFLAAFEKRGVRRSLTAYIELLDSHVYRTRIGEGIFTISIEEANESIADHLQYQAEINKEMSWFELAPYPLPDHIQAKPNDWRDRKSFRAFHDKMSPMIQKGDTLSCVIVDQADYKKGSVVVVSFRQHKDRTRKYSFGRVKKVDANSITLGFDHPDCKYDYITIPLQMVLFVLKVESAQAPSKPVK
ncbi:hypothetical protein [Spirosoma endophyticum]|uniref:Uncharacterized protein n=1 Tax=Spirosoma endophyticum TaxID=662367 RepID=A0A1I2G4P2_9BACT|nr:hypothetical protein [Spirosoma endophyticum]SFF11601.1 hypothetical protein SAMN05216167_12933 [Spirosoma endophyticum]